MNDGKRLLSQLERATKFGRTSSSTGDFSAALQSVQHDAITVPGSFSGSFTGSFSLRAQLHPPIAHPPRPYGDDFPALEHALQTLRGQRMDEYRQAVYIAPMAKSNLQASDDNLFPLMENVKEFLAGDGQVMLILGDSGAGKSTFNRHLENKLWQDYKLGGRIPLFINLPGLERPEKELVAEQLRILDFSDEQIRELRQYRRFILVCDGYDESQLTSNLHTTNLLNQSGQWNAKLIITCRTQYLGSDYRNRFVPKASSQYYRSAKELFQEAVIAPFSTIQIEDFVERYVPLEPRTWIKEDYMEKLTTIPNLMDMVRNPFLLTLCLEALPSVVEGKTDLSRLRVTRVHLYDNFVEHWMAVNKRRLQEQKLSGQDLKALQELLDDGFEKTGIKFQQDLATAIFQEQDGRPVVDYTHRGDKNSWKAAFFSLEPETTLLRTASLLSRVANQFRFVHRSVLEYFYSCTICPPVSKSEEFAPQAYFHSKNTGLLIVDHPLSRRNLVAEPSIVQFLSERVNSNPAFKQHLHDLLERSKTDESAAPAAANVITILVRARVRFNGADLRNIRIPGADLTAGQFDSAQLQGADLSGVNFSKGWIRQANFSGAQMQGMQFGELPYLEERRWTGGCSLFCTYSPDGKMLAVIQNEARVTLYSTDTWTKIRDANEDFASSACFGFSFSSNQLVFADENCTLLLQDIETGLHDLVLEGHEDVLSAVAFSPCGKRLVSASRDRTVRVWDASTGAAISVFAGHVSKVTCISFSPSGSSVASSACDGTIRVLDAQLGLPGLVLESTFGSITSIAYSPDGQWIVSGDDDSELQLWNVATGALGHNWTGHIGCITSVAYSPTGRWIISSSEDGTVKVWNAQTRRLVSDFYGHNGVVNNAVFSPDGFHVASGGQDGTVRLWQLPLTDTEVDIHGSTGPISNVFYPPDGQQLLCINDTVSVRQYDARSCEPALVFLTGDRGDNTSVVFSPDGLRFASTGDSSETSVWSIEAGRTEVTFRDCADMVSVAAFSPYGNTIATGSYDGTVRLWDAHSRLPCRVLGGIYLEVKFLVFSPDGLHLLSCSDDPEEPIRVWILSTGKYRVLRDDDIGVSAIAYSPDGRSIASMHFGDSDLKIWDEHSGECLFTLKHDDYYADSEKYIAFSSCGQWVAVASQNSLWIWKYSVNEAMEEQWQRGSAIDDFLSNISAVVWRPHVLDLAVGCEDGSVRVFTMQDTSSEWSALLVWSTATPVFVASNAVISDVVGLSSINRRLLLQRGAYEGESLMAKAEETRPASTVKDMGQQ